MRGVHRWPVKSLQRPVTQTFDGFVDLRLNKRLNKQSWWWWFEIHRAHYDVTVVYPVHSMNIIHFDKVWCGIRYPKLLLCCLRLVHRFLFEICLLQTGISWHNLFQFGRLYNIYWKLKRNYILYIWIELIAIFQQSWPLFDNSRENVFFPWMIWRTWPFEVYTYMYVYIYYVYIPPRRMSEIDSPTVPLNVIARIFAQQTPWINGLSSGITID